MSVRLQPRPPSTASPQDQCEDLPGMDQIRLKPDLMENGIFTHLVTQSPVLYLIIFIIYNDLQGYARYIKFATA